MLPWRHWPWLVIWKLDWAGRLTSMLVHLHGGCRRPWFLVLWTPPKNCLIIFVRKWFRREQGRSCNDFCDLLLKVTQKSAYFICWKWVSNPAHAQRRNIKILWICFKTITVCGKCIWCCVFSLLVYYYFDMFLRGKVRLRLKGNENLVELIST